MSAPVCALLLATPSCPHPSPASVGFRSSGSPSPRPTLPPFAFPSQPPPLVGFVPSRPQRPSHRAIASRRCLSCPSCVPPARDTPLRAACRLLPLPAPRTLLRPPLPTSDPSRSPPVPHRPINGKRPANNEQVNPHFVCVSDAHARSRKGSVSAPPPRTTRVSCFATIRFQSRATPGIQPLRHEAGRLRPCKF